MIRTRRERHGAPAKRDRWLVSYADFITLLFAFFVVMFASSHTDKIKARQVSDSVEQAFGGKRGESKTKSIVKLSQTAGAVGGYPDLSPTLHALSAELKGEIDTGKMTLSLQERGLVVSLRQATFFPSGEDTLAPATFGIIEKVASAIRKLPNPVRLEGHTDSVRIHTGRFRSNWDLSTARSIAMLDVLTNHCGIDPRRLAVAGYAETVPVDSNDSGEGRSHNRRVDIVILARSGIAAEPQGK